MEFVIKNEEKYKGVKIMGKGKGKRLTKKLYKLYISVLSILILPALGFMISQIILLNRETSGIEDIKNDITEINNGLNGNKGLYARLAIIENELDIDISTINIPNEFVTAFIGEVTNEYYASNNNKYSLNSKIIIGEDSNGKPCLAENFVNKTILLTYTENYEDSNFEIYFLGQYNENYHWDGFCVTNVYYSEGELSGKLHEICESDFDDGKRLNFKSIHYNPEENDWLYSDRKIINDVNVGINKHLLFSYNKTKSFTHFNARPTDILFVDNFLKNVNPTMTKYYSGNTSNSYFNDTSGNAYRATYFKDGTVESLYKGNFVDGPANDDTGHAWEIYYSEKDKSYVYCKGKFENDIYKGEDRILVSINEINSIIKDYNFECGLNWKEN